MSNELYDKAKLAGYADEETGQVNDFFVDCWLADVATFDVMPQVDDPAVCHQTAVCALRDFGGDVAAAIEWLTGE